MTEPTPPPEQPLPDHARARIRAELLDAARESTSGGSRWLVPGLSAVAVALVAGLAYAAVSLGDNDGAAPSGPTSFAPETDRPSTIPSDEPSDPPDAHTSVPPNEPPPTGQVGTAACPVELEHVLKGAEEVFVFPDGPAGGTTSVYVKGDQFSLCDARAGTTTVTHPLPLTPAADDVATYRVLSIYPPTKDGYRTVRVAGGVVPAGAEDFFDVAYAFPDGHTEHAIKTTDDQGRTWWLMVHSYDDGGGNEREKPPIEVTVSYSGVQRHYSLEWGVDTCAQANHGC
jgi:hypothetical protein